MRYFSLFSGVGGFEIGIQKAYESLGDTHEQKQSCIGTTYQPSTSGGSERKLPVCIGFSEIDKYASAVLKYRFPNVTNYGDITKIDWAAVPDFDLLVGGSPCQDLSVAGRRNGLQGKRSGLFYEYIRCLKERQPRYFIWENVKGALSSNQGWDFAEVVSAFSEAGYALWWQVLNAKDFGVPQNRERVFIVGTRSGSSREIFFERGAAEESNLSYLGGASKRDWAGDGKQLSRNVPQAYRVYRDDGISQTLASGTGGLGRVSGLIAQNWDNYKDESHPKQVPPQGDKPMIIARGINHPSRGIEIRPDELAATIKSGESGTQRPKALVGDRIRRLTPKECERLMSWPDNWTRWGTFEEDVARIREISDTQRYKMCGNGVVSAVVREVVKAHVL